MHPAHTLRGGGGATSVTESGVRCVCGGGGRGSSSGRRSGGGGAEGLSSCAVKMLRPLISLTQSNMASFTFPYTIKHSKEQNSQHSMGPVAVGSGPRPCRAWVHRHPPQATLRLDRLTIRLPTQAQLGPEGRDTRLPCKRNRACAGCVPSLAGKVPESIFSQSRSQKLQRDPTGLPLQDSGRWSHVRQHATSGRTSSRTRVVAKIF